jgi:glycosyltransferase involved in cell wall biosynthesis
VRILYQCNGFLLSTIGGVEVLSYHLLKELRRRGHDVLVVTGREQSDASGAQTFDGLDLVRLDFEQAVSSRNLIVLRNVKTAVAELVSRFRPDILHLNDALLSSFLFLRGGATGNLPRVLTLHSPIRPAGKDGLQAHLAADADRIVTVSQAQYDDAAATMPALRGKMSMIPNALPWPDLQPTELALTPPVLLCIGRMRTDKGFDLAIRMFARLRERGVIAKFVAAGDGPEKGRLEALARGLGLADHIDFPGWVAPDRVLSMINTSTVVVMPSRWPEPFGLVALQAAQMGRPVVACRVGGLPEVVDHERTGLLVVADDEQAMADTIESLLSDVSSVKRMGERARQRARDKFDFATLVDAYEKLYAEAQALDAVERDMVG